jgi:hypothetical protein
MLLKFVVLTTIELADDSFFHPASSIRSCPRTCVQLPSLKYRQHCHIAGKASSVRHGLLVHCNADHSKR